MCNRENRPKYLHKGFQYGVLGKVTEPCQARSFPAMLSDRLLGVGVVGYWVMGKNNQALYINIILLGFSHSYPVINNGDFNDELYVILY